MVLQQRQPPSLRGWEVELNKRAQLRKKLPGWRAHVLRRSLELRDAVLADQFSLIKELLADGADINYCDPARNGRCPLHMASARDTKDAEATVEILLDSGADVNSTDAAGNTALHYAAAIGSLENVACLLEYGANPQLLNVQGEGSLHLAAKTGTTYVVVALLTAGAINGKGGCGALPLELALQTGNHGVARELIKV